MKREATIVISIMLLIVPFIFAESETPVGTFTVGDAAPNQPTNFRVQDGASSWDSASSPDTHDLTPNINWSVSDDNGDSITTYVCVATNSSNRDSNNCDANFTSSTTANVTALTGLAYLGASRTYYVRLTPNDGTQNGTALDINFTLINNVPTTPSGLSPTTTHNQTPTLSWTAVDADDGTDDKWPADSLTYSIRVGTSYGDGSYVNNDSADKTGEFVSSAIPWGTPGAIWANNTVYVSIWTSDGSNSNSSYYNTTLVLYDNLLDIIDISLSDAGSAYSSCTSSTCAINPIEHSNSTVAVRVIANDTDNDCDSVSTAYVYLCLDTTCNTSIGNYSWQLDSITRSGSQCNYTFSTNKTASDSTPEFFRAGSATYHLYANVTSNSGARTTDAERNASWTYGTLKSIDYASTVTLGDGSITLGSWNNGTTLATMTNWGNDVLNIQWNATNPTSGGDTWTLNGTDFQIDDDNDYNSETSGVLSPVNLDGTLRTFEPTTGLERCITSACDDAGVNETLATYYHIAPPIGLEAGTYNSTLTIIIS